VHRKPASILIALLAVVALVVTACGGKSGGTAASTQSTTASVPTTTIPSTPTTATTATTPAAAAIAGLATSKNCRDLAGLSTKLGQAFTGTANGDVKAYADYLNALADKAPADIRPDFKVIADAYTKILGALGNTNLNSGSPPDPATLAKLVKVGQSLNQPALAKASANIGAWLQKNCVHG
jgi:Flp pilus assembly protein TadD